MEYIIFIDESGSINAKNKDTIFSVSLVLIASEKQQSAKNYFKRENKILKQKLSMSIKDELKAHHFVQSNNQNLLFSLRDKFLETPITSYSSYISNLNIKKHFLKNKNLTYNFLVFCALERLMDSEKINLDDSLKIIADNREVNTGSLNSLKDYLILKFIIEKKCIKEIDLKFQHSHLHWGIQLADYISWVNYDEIKRGVNLYNKRKVY